MRVGLAAVAAPAVWRNGRAADSIKIGMPMALTGPLGSVGQQMKRGAEFWAKLAERQGRAARPADRDGVRRHRRRSRHLRAQGAGDGGARRHAAFSPAITLSSEALAVVPKLAEWDTIFISSDNGDGRLTAEILRAELLPRQHLRPDGHARGGALAARVEDAELLCDRARLRLGPQQHRRVRVRGEEGEEELRRRGLSRRSAPRTTRPTSPRSASPARTPASS